MRMRYGIVIDKTASGFSAHVPDLPGCIAAGIDLRETERLMREAIEFHLEGMRQHGEQIPEPTAVAEYVNA